ncbi:hypothetical protein LTR70_005498 [Exophiala xenobiotica]|uniref:Putative lipoate-protein ligase A n=1 Tax=Lithohypha guttulata TaxID=1690604 RepID=A0ABR0KDT5_9EURO|nr:hypothetical protein LTR24_003865 [Lithohypha guttulata]KAK5318355.1 hypothetical protein LTR70_005498 [Exophiala xenobiotica]
MLVGALSLASRCHTSHVDHRRVLAYASQSLALRGHGHSVQCAGSFNGRWRRQSRRLSTSSAIDTNNALPRIKEFTTQHPVSIFRSLSNDPYHNLAIENYLLKNSEPNSRILFTYTNRPCVVFGRNQNPWLECNIAKVQEGLAWCTPDWAGDTTIKEVNTTFEENGLVALDLVRRRSGGGTVIHDVGNLNFSFIVPNDKDFTRNKHAWLVVSVLRDYQQHREKKHGSAKVLFDKVRVNERHDIVMTRRSIDGDVEDTQEYKASGSAFKLTRGRALHHGTLLHSSPNVGQTKEGDARASTFSTLLSSPARPFLQAKGVTSVRSPVHNLFRVSKPEGRWKLASDLEIALGSTFGTMYNDHNAPCIVIGDKDCHREVNTEIHEDVQEMMTDEWRFCQTPSFEYASTHSDGNIKLQFDVKHGIIQSAILHAADRTSAANTGFAALEGKKLHEVQSWKGFIPETFEADSAQIRAHLASVFPKIHPANTNGKLAPTSIIEEKSAAERAPGGIAIKRRSGEGNEEVEERGENVIIQR